MDDQGHIRLTDFGLSHALNRGKRRVVSYSGTVLYMSPEILLQDSSANNGHSKGSDFWALGVLLHLLATQEAPFWSDVMQKMIDLILSCDPSKILASPEYDFVDETLKDLIRRLLDPNEFTRLGYSAGYVSSEGVSQIQQHPFFYSLDWNSLEQKAIPSPFVPPVKEIDRESHLGSSKIPTDLLEDISFLNDSSSDAPAYDDMFPEFHYSHFDHKEKPSALVGFLPVPSPRASQPPTSPPPLPSGESSEKPNSSRGLLTKSHPEGVITNSDEASIEHIDPNMNSTLASSLPKGVRPKSLTILPSKDLVHHDASSKPPGLSQNKTLPHSRSDGIETSSDLVSPCSSPDPEKKQKAKKPALIRAISGKGEKEPLSHGEDGEVLSPRKGKARRLTIVGLKQKDLNESMNTDATSPLSPTVKETTSLPRGRPPSLISLFVRDSKTSSSGSAGAPSSSRGPKPEEAMLTPRTKEEKKETRFRSNTVTTANRKGDA